MTIVSLITRFLDDLLKTQEYFFENPKKMGVFENEVADASHKFAADFMSMSLTLMDDMIRKSSKRKEKYNIQRRDSRMLISTVGDVTFSHTLFTDRETGKGGYLLDELLGLPDRERFSELAEAKVLYEAEVHSYQHAADSLCVGNQTITKQAVMDKIHSISEELPTEDPLPDNEKKCCEFLYIEADEDHIARQKSDSETKGLIGKLIYVFEGKEEICEGRKQLVNAHYFGGLYPGSDANKELWEQVWNYIESRYDTDLLKRVYICGDGGGWLKAGTDYIDKSVFVADKFHLMKYINLVSNLTLDERNLTKQRFYKYIYGDKLLAVKKLLTRIKNSAGHDEKIEEVRTYFENNWEYIQRAFHDKNALGCSAEGHVSCVYSERMSSRPMGWSEIGSDRMCKLRCYVWNYGKEKITDLVAYRRRNKMGELAATGTDDYVAAIPRKRYSKEQREVMRYAELMQASIGGNTVRKTLAIREHIQGL